MRWRRLSCLCVAAFGGCLDQDAAVDGAFTPDQWARLAAEYTLPPQLTQDPAGGNGGAVLMSELGQRMFFDGALSKSGTVSCATCHDPGGWFIDTRNPNNVSLGVNGFTGRNSTSLVNIGLKSHLAPQNDDDGDAHQVFTASGGWKNDKTLIITTLASPGSVLDLAIVKPMASSHLGVQIAVTNSTWYRARYKQVFGIDLPPCPVGSTACPGTESVFSNLENAMTMYLDRLISVDAPFDSWLRGEDTPDMTDAAKRGFAVFVGRGMCAECHSGPMFSDFKFHNTGVPQTGAIDSGRGVIDGNPDDKGKFLTGTLRQITGTGPYMHNGYYKSLDEVIEFYRRGGEPGIVGTVDPRMVPTDMTDADASDLERFLASLTGKPVATDLATNGCTPPMGSTTPGAVCGGTCVDLRSDQGNCGHCGNTCVQCVAGQCVP